MSHWRARTNDVSPCGGGHSADQGGMQILRTSASALGVVLVIAMASSCSASGSSTATRAFRGDADSSSTTSTTRRTSTTSTTESTADTVFVTVPQHELTRAELRAATAEDLGQ